MLQYNSQYGQMDYIGSKKTTPNVAPAFYVEGIVRYLDKEQQSDKLSINVNNHNTYGWQFDYDTLNLFSNNSILADFCKNKVIINPKYESDVLNYLIYGYNDCLNNNRIEYLHHSLGWVQNGDDEVFLYQQNDINGITSYSDRTNFKFCSGDEQVYKDFLTNTVYPVPTLALAMSLRLFGGYNIALKE